MARKKKKSYRAKIGYVAKAEGGKSQAKMGDVMQIQAEVFKLCAKDPAFLARGLGNAQRKIDAERAKARRKRLAKKR